MQRRAQRQQAGQRAKRLTRVLVCAAVVPVTLVVAGCSSDSGSEDAKGEAPGVASSASAKPSPTVQAAAYKSLPQACKVLSKKALKDLVPKAKSGKEGNSDDISARASCSWSSLDNNGVKGSQFRWLNVSLLRFESDVTRGAGDKLAKEYYGKQVRDAQGAEGAKNVKSEPLAGTGDEATSVRYELKKKEGTFKQQTVVARVENVVVTLDYNGAGLAGDKTPDGAALLKDAQKAVKEVVAAVTEANSKGASPAPSKPASSSSSKSGSKESPKESPKESSKESSEESSPESSSSSKASGKS